MTPEHYKDHTSGPCGVLFLYKNSLQGLDYCIISMWQLSLLTINATCYNLNSVVVEVVVGGVSSGGAGSNGGCWGWRTCYSTICGSGSGSPTTPSPVQQRHNSKICQNLHVPVKWLGHNLVASMYQIHYPKKEVLGSILKHISPLEDLNKFLLPCEKGYKMKSCTTNH